MAQNRYSLFYSSESVDVKVDPGALKHLPADMKEAILQRSKKTDAQIKAEATIRMLEQQLKDAKLSPRIRTELEELLNKMKNENVNTEVTQTTPLKKI